MKALGLTSLVAALFLAASPLSAQQADNPLAAREARLPNILSYLQSQGVKLTSLGDEGGLPGYLGESVNGKAQSFYVTPDGNHVVLGILFRTGGTNVTGIQIGEMRYRHATASESLVNATMGDVAPGQNARTQDAQKRDAAKAPSPAPVSSAPPIAEGAAPTAGNTNPVSAPAGSVPSGDKASSVTVPPPSGPVQGAMGNRSDIWISKIDRDEFLNTVSQAPFFEVGAVSARPLLWLVADPQCPHCHKAWDRLGKLVYAKKLRVRVVLIAGLQGSEPKAREILARPVPARAWLDSNAGASIELSTDRNSQEWQAAEGYLATNMEIAKKFGIDRTPFLAYVGQDGAFYSALGLPSDLDAFLAASGAL